MISLPGKILVLNRFETFALERMADPLNAVGLWFAKHEVPGSMLKLVREQLVACIDEDRLDICFQITADGINYYNLVIRGKEIYPHGPH